MTWPVWTTRMLHDNTSWNNIEFAKFRRPICARPTATDSQIISLSAILLSLFCLILRHVRTELKQAGCQICSAHKLTRRRR